MIVKEINLNYNKDQFKMMIKKIISSFGGRKTVKDWQVETVLLKWSGTTSKYGYNRNKINKLYEI